MHKRITGNVQLFTMTENICAQAKYHEYTDFTLRKIEKYKHTGTAYRNMVDREEISTQQNTILHREHLSTAKSYAQANHL